MNTFYRIRALLWAVFLYMYVVWFSEYWLSTTENLVTWTLAALLLIEWITPRGKGLKRLFQLLAIGGVAFWILDYRPILQWPKSWDQLSDILRLNVEPLLPYVWFSLIAGVLFMFVSDWADSKKRTILLVSLTLLAFCIADSFTQIIFWPSILMLVICGLLLVMTQHFGQFKEQHPASWGTLKEYPGIVIATIVFVLSAIILAGIYAPHVRPVLTDPYTAWMNYRGETVPNLGKGFSTSGQIQLSNSSGYSRNDESLGGGFTYDYSEVMSVTMSQRSYMRGETRTLYTGQGWQNTEADRTAPAEQVTEGVDFSVSENWDTSKLETIEVEQTISFVSDEAHYPVLFGAFAPVRVDRLADENEEFSYAPLSWVQDSQELRWDEDQQSYPSTYTIVSQAPVIDEPGLRTAYEGEGLPPDFNPAFLQTNENMPERVSALTREITAEADTPYDKVKAIEQYLSTEFTYTNNPDTSKITSSDFVDAFLFEVQEGYCDYFSTAMVMMVRDLGYPARWVKGYTSGAQALPDEVEDLMQMEGTNLEGEGEYIVRNADAHSWPEVYFPGWGWIPFEPTVGFAMPHVESQAEENQGLAEIETPVQTEEELGEGGSDGRNVNRIWLITIMIALSLTAGVLIYQIIMARRQKNRQLNGGHKLIAEFNRFMRFAVRKGLDRSENETVREWMNHSIRHHKWLESDLPELIYTFEQAKYSPEPLSQTEVEKALETIRSLRQKLKR